MKRLLAFLLILTSTIALASDMTHSPCFQSGGWVQCYPASGIKIDKNKTIRFYELTANGTNYVSLAASANVASDFVLTLPSASDILVGKNTTDTLTNKTISGASNTITRVSLTTGVTGILPQANGGTGTSTPGTSLQVLHSGTTPTFSSVVLTTDVSGTLPLSNGGTSATTKAGAFDALSPMNAAGDIIYGGTSGTGTQLAKGTSLTVLHSGTIPTFSAVALTADVSGTLPLANGGTSATTKAGAFDALSPMAAAGDIIYGGVSGTGTVLNVGAATTVLHGGASAPAYSQIVNADVSTSAAIAGSKITAATNAAVGTVTYESTGTFSITWIGPRTITATANYSRIGQHVCIAIPADTATTCSTGVAFTAAAGMPASLRATHATYAPVFVKDNGTDQATPGYITHNGGTGNLTLDKSFTAHFTGTLSCGYYDLTYCYTIN